jgi:hypothetical protein
MLLLTKSNGPAQTQMTSPTATESLSSAEQIAAWPPLLDPANPYTKSVDGRVIERFTHESRSQWGYQISQTNYFFLVHPKKRSGNAPLCVILHSANRTAFDYLGYCFLNRKVDPGDNPSDFGEKVPDDFYGLFIDSNNGEWWGWTSASSDRKKYSTEPTPTENRVLDTVEWVVKRYHIDRNRIYLTGVSMGGCGSLGIGMPHGDIFAALRVWVPAGAEYVSCRMGYDPHPSKDARESQKTAWSNFISNAQFPDPPPVIDLSASNDTWSKDQDILQNMALDGHLQLVIGWGPFGHTGAHSPVAKYPYCAAVLALPWMEIRKNEAYPVFKCASTDQRPPWSNPPGNADESGQINGYFRWKNTTDTQSEFVMQLWLEKSTTNNPTAIFPTKSVADITLRRIQHFKLVRDHPYEWNLIQKKKSVASGVVQPDAAGLITIPSVIITSAPVDLCLKTK